MTPDDIRSLRNTDFALHKDIPAVFAYVQRAMPFKQRAKVKGIAGAAINTAFETIAKLYEAELALRWTPVSQWEDHPEFRASDWQHLVANDLTLLGYVDWVNFQLESREDHLARVTNPSASA
ncbi:hypothetical protein [Kineobactrum salinum]|uniref:Uncharacterized protein n=1 Tax=Kineobactrum salinum TaxID=2708301 RepID=A0A6C0U7Y6_9GAMM|nr:hypothetical protein [Kineobactrum salinum]QIB67117.1 hypothetical protein G3T16_18665 [Kineobactrum salinum]